MHLPVRFCGNSNFSGKVLGNLGFELVLVIRSVQFRFKTFSNVDFLFLEICALFFNQKKVTLPGRGNRCHCESFHLGNLHGDRDCSVPQNDRVFVSYNWIFQKKTSQVDSVSRRFETHLDLGNSRQTPWHVEHVNMSTFVRI